MARKAQRIIDEASKLPKKQQVEVLARLMDVLDQQTPPDVAAAWDAEIKRRIKDIDSGKAKMIPWQTVRKRLWGRVRAAKKLAS